MKNEIEDLRRVVDQLLIENNMQRAHINVLTTAILEITSHVYTETESKNFETHLWGTLIEKTRDGLNQLSDGLYNPAKGAFAQLDFETFYRQKLKDLGIEDY